LASLARRLAGISRRPERWLNLAAHASERSTDLVFDHHALPATWGLAARHQRLGATIDIARYALAYSDPVNAHSALRSARGLLVDLGRDWSALVGSESGEEMRQQVRIGLLGTARAAWRIALLERDREAVTHSRERAWARIGLWTPPNFIDELNALKEQGSLLGLEVHEEPEIASDIRRLFNDRAANGLRGRAQQALIWTAQP